MIAILSPARKFGQEIAPHALAATLPEHLPSSRRLLDHLRQFSPWELESLLRTSPQLALQAYDYYQNMDLTALDTPAILAYRGIAYKNLSPQTFNAEELQYAQDHLRLLSAFYGVLRPGDLISPYRLELISRVRPGGETLYAYWGNAYYTALTKRRAVLVNLCSSEYSKAFLPYLTTADKVVTCRFLVAKKGRLQCLATPAKEARGQMARYLVRNRLKEPRQLQGFQWNNYRYMPALSTDDTYTFVLGEE